MATQNSEERINVDIQNSTPSLTSTNILSSEMSDETKTIGRLHNIHVEQRSHRGSSKPSYSRILQHHFSKRKEKRRDETNHQSLSIELPHINPHFQNGKLSINSDEPIQGTMGSLSRFRGRLFSHTSSKKLQKIPPFHTQQSRLAVQGTSFRTVSSPLLFHRSHDSSELSVSSKRYKNSPLSRRLVDKSIFEGVGDKTCTLSHTLNVRSRTESKRTEKSIRTNPKKYFFWAIFTI